MEEELEDQEEDIWINIFSSASHPLNNTEITNYFNYELWFNDVFSRNNFPRIKDGAYVINLNDSKSQGTHWISLFIDRNITLYFDFFWNWISSTGSIKQYQR